MSTPAAPPTASNLEFRELRRSDRAPFLEAVETAYGPFESMLGFGQTGKDEFGALFSPGIWYLLRLLRALGRPPIQFLVAADQGRVVATTGLVVWPTAGYILAVGTLPTHRRRGLAGQLMDRAEAITRTKHRPWAVLDTEAENHPAVTLYTARQYERVGRAWWLRRSGPPTATAQTGAASGARALGSKGRRAAAEWCARFTAPRLREVVPPDEHRLTHLESLAQAPGGKRETFAIGPVTSPTGYLVAAWRGSLMPGLLLLPAWDPQIPPAHLGGLIAAGEGWLASKGCPSVVAMVPDTIPSALPVFAGLGYAEQMTTITLARRLDRAPGNSGAPNTP